MQFVNRAHHFCRSIIWLAFIAVGGAALFAIAQLNAERTFARNSPVFSYLFGLTVVACALSALYKWGDVLYTLEDQIAEVLCRMSLRRFLLVCLLAGIALRVAWAALFPAPLRSDGFAYFDLARKLAQGQEYRSFDRGELAYWPPGYPLFLCVGLKLFGLHRWVVTILNLLLFSVSIPLVYAVATWVADEKVGRLSALLLVTWPNYVAAAGVGSKEMVMVPCLMLMLLLYFRSRRAREVGELSGLCLAAGALLGFASLTVPSFLMFPLVLLTYEWLSYGLPKGFVRLTLVLVSMAAVISPWALRNKETLGEWILISDNGGDVFYRANNSRSTGGYVSEGAQPLRGNEVQRNRLGYQLGRQWISSHPGEFLWLAERKLTFLLGDDGDAIFESLKRGLGISDWRYYLFRTLGNGYWFLVWMSLLATVWRYWRAGSSFNSELLALMLSFLYLLPIHSVFEADSRHHVPMVGVLSVVAAALVCRVNPQSVSTMA